MSSLEGVVAIVTGGARGIGASCVEVMATRGATVVIADILDKEGEETAHLLKSKGLAVVFRHLDCADPNGWAQLVRYVEAAFGGIDCLVNNAGISITVTLENASLEQFQHILDINLLGPFLGTQAVLPVMKKRGGGSIINIASMATARMAAETSIYGVSKAALAQLTKAAAINFAQQGYNIRVNSVHPGVMQTEMNIGKDLSDVTRAAVEKIVANIPYARMGKPEEVASVVAFLASADSSYMSGAELFVDGASTIVL
jgi:3alpha(or 20beta)-hydroxysteroid dehydrogenase